MSDMWTTITAGRGALADDLGRLSEAEWNARSLCRTGGRCGDTLAT